MAITQQKKDNFYEFLHKIVLHSDYGIGIKGAKKREIANMITNEAFIYAKTRELFETTGAESAMKYFVGPHGLKEWRENNGENK